MIRHPSRPTATVLAVVLLTAWTGALAPAAAAAQEGRPPSPDYTHEPGYVDFEALGLTAPEGGSSEDRGSFRISLYGPILRLVAEATKGEEPGFSELLEKLQAIRADIYPAPPGDVAELRRRTVDAARALERRGWQTVVEVRSGGGDLSFIQTRTEPAGPPGAEGDRISGLAVMFVEPGGSAGFINIVGDVSPEELGRLGRTFDIEPLVRLEESSAEPGEKDGKEKEEPR